MEFVRADICSDMPAGQFDNIVCDSALEHFTRAEIATLLADVRTRLHREGVFSGHTIMARPDGIKSLPHLEYEFKGKEDLLAVLTPYFRHVTVFETIYPTRHNLYFWASDGRVPFRHDWPNLVTEHWHAAPGA